MQAGMSAWTWHGGQLAQARRVYGGTEWLDLSTGINPNAWPVEKAPQFDWRALPGEDELADLERAAARHFGVDPVHVCAIPGTEIGLRLLGDLIPVREAAHVTPCYRTHAEMLEGSTATSPDAITAVAGGALVLANPNNPDGRLLSGKLLEAVLADQAAASGWLVVDEAFADAVPESSLAHRIAEGAPLVVFRSFGKFFGLAGVRLGFLLGPAEVVNRCRIRLGAWPVSSAALSIGTAAYADATWIASMVDRLRQDSANLDEVLRRHGFLPIGKSPLFRLIETDDAHGLFHRLARQAVLTRPFEDNSRWLRVGLPGNRKALDRLDRALEHG